MSNTSTEVTNGIQISTSRVTSVAVGRWNICSQLSRTMIPKIFCHINSPKDPYNSIYSVLKKNLYFMYSQEKKSVFHISTKKFVFHILTEKVCIPHINRKSLYLTYSESSSPISPWSEPFLVKTFFFQKSSNAVTLRMHPIKRSKSGCLFIWSVCGPISLTAQSIQIQLATFHKSPSQPV